MSQGDVSTILAKLEALHGRTLKARMSEVQGEQAASRTEASCQRKRRTPV